MEEGWRRAVYWKSVRTVRRGGWGSPHLYSTDFAAEIRSTARRELDRKRYLVYITIDETKENDDNVGTMMRLEKDKIDFFKKEIKRYLPDFRLYLFGSRTNDNKKGGDIDILILSSNPLARKDKRSIKIAFYNKFGYQKLDLVHFTFDDPSPFKELALMEGIEL